MEVQWMYCAHAILVELLIVIAILGVLAAVIIPNVSKFTQSGAKAAGQSEMASVQTAVYAAMADNGTSTVTAATISSGGDMAPVCAPWLQGGLAKLKGSWVIGTDGGITGGTYAPWTFASPSIWHT
jgi:type IV pilus assembly protein PilA